ncbi:flagellar filament capping protein FliD [Paenibacillus sp. PAMC 26794]|uniref:flagellar filament capping protein FliD n=1 Tax=Paenibacillus sp. PAMC 26794 TaxID=1257080 RepID=UPI0003150ACC|nr:flagellar filament capping protein FliD [Paenibacillus sp. PAMC 26794]
MRISGLASGLDIDAMVKQLMTAEKAPLDKINQQKTQAEWKRDNYRTISTKLVSFNEKLSNLNLSKNIDSKQAVVTGATGVLTATATGVAANSVLNVSVKNLASSSNAIYQGTAGATKMSDLYSGTETSVTIGKATISFTADDTIDSFVKKINSNKDSGVTAVYNSATGGLSLTNRDTGNKDIELSGELFTSNTNFTTAGVNKGVDATVVINGLETKQTSNRFTVNGVEISLTGVTPTGQTNQIEVTQNTDAIIDTIKSFVDFYNETIALMNQKTNEERYRTYLPLSTEQKADMKDSEIELWESKAKSGLLKNDSILNKSLSDMRTAMISEFNFGGTKLNITQFGITTGSYSEKGKLVLDEDKLRTALESNPEQVTALFSQVDSSSKGITNNDGLFNRIKKINATALESLSEKAGTSKISSDLSTAFLPQSQMGNQLTAYERRITELQARLTRKENQYYKQFTAMETAMNKYNSTSSSLSSMLG